MMITDMRDKLEDSPFLEIDLHFVEYILETESPEQYHKPLMLACLLLSQFANQQHALLPLNELDKVEYDTQLPFEFSDADRQELKQIENWAEAFPRTIGVPGSLKPIIFYNEALYLYKYFVAEQAVLNFVQHSRDVLEFGLDLEKPLNHLFSHERGDEEKVNWQKVAAFMALRSRFCVISGGPGTGKTTTVAKILALLLMQEPSLKIHLVAPTGKAAERLSQSILKVKSQLKNLVEVEVLAKIPDKATTLHRYLAYHGGEQKFRMNARHPTNSDLVLVDECSMVDLPLFKHFLEALKASCRVILLGDKDQLSAVETGNVLGDLTQMEMINTFSKEFCEAYQSIDGRPFDYESSESGLLDDCVVKLEHSYRFKADQGIGRLANWINQASLENRDSEIDVLFKSFEDITLKSIPKKVQMDRDLNFQFFEKYQSYLQKDCQPEKVLQLANEYKVLCSKRSGSCGVEAINTLISQEFFESEDHELYHGRMVMIMQNNRHLDLYNGDVGVILLKQGLPSAYFLDESGGVRAFNPTLLPEFETAFAMTVHKSQGSEYNEVSIFLEDTAKAYVKKELVYTAVTRARQKVTLYCERDHFKMMCANRTKRYSGLPKLLCLS